MKKVLITGASGFLGAVCLSPLLTKGFQIEAISTTTRASSASIQWRHLDLFDKKAISEFMQRTKPTHLLHLAWYTEPVKYWNSPLNVAWLENSLHLVEEFLRSGGSRIVVAGTCAEYQWGHPLCDETITPCDPNTLYGASKHSLFLLGKKKAELAGASFASGRLFHLYGAQEKKERLVPSVMLGLLNHKPVPCSHGEQIRDFLHIQDAADAFAEILDSPIHGAVNIGSGEQVKLKQIIQLIGEKIGNRHLIQWGSLPSNPSDPEILVPSLHRICKELGWKRKISLAQGLDEVIEWWKRCGSKFQ